MSITQPGDLWIIGQHKLICGDATDPITVASLMGEEKADLCFTSPPYLQQRMYITGVGDWDALMEGVFAGLPTTRTAPVLVNLGLVHRRGEVLPYWTDWQRWMSTQGWKFFGWYIWDKGSGLPGDWNGRLAPSFEFLFHFNRVAKKPHKTKPKQPGSIKCCTRKGMLRNQDGSISAVNNRSASLATHKIPDDVVRVRREAAPETARAHPAIFPVRLPIEMMTAYSDPQQIVYEPFSGSGTTIVAAQKTGRRCRAVELQPEYCDLAIRRIQQETGLIAVHARSKAWFEVPNWLEFVTPTRVRQDHMNDDRTLNTANAA